MDCAKEDQPLGGDLHAVLDKIKANILKNTKINETEINDNST